MGPLAGAHINGADQTNRAGINVHMVGTLPVYTSLTRERHCLCERQARSSKLLWRWAAAWSPLGAADCQRCLKELLLFSVRSWILFLVGRFSLCGDQLL
jgi:hypothetical protein